MCWPWPHPLCEPMAARQDELGVVWIDAHLQHAELRTSLPGRGLRDRAFGEVIMSWTLLPHERISSLIVLLPSTFWGHSLCHSVLWRGSNGSHLFLRCMVIFPVPYACLVFRRPEGDPRCPGTVPDTCESPRVGAKNQTRVFWKSSRYS